MNRANALRSTGPRTPAGKARSRRNSRTHGLTCKTLLLDGEGQEDVKEFRRLLRRFQEDLAPANAIEEVLVERLVISYWRLGSVVLAELAFVYVRQSSPQQVRCNRESQRRQYDFAAQAEGLGWRRDQIVIIDEDQGTSGVIPYARTGFGDLVSRVARGEGGIVLSLELSRFARNDPDWHHLVYLCRWTETLIADEQGLYDPTVSADRMVLGIRGQVSALERDNPSASARAGESMSAPRFAMARPLSLTK